MAYTRTWDRKKTADSPKTAQEANSTRTPRQRAVLVLRDVLGFRAPEVAQMLESSEDSVKGALKRARATLESRLPSSGREGAPLPDSPAERELVGRFATAFTAGDTAGVLALLTDDAWVSMPPMPFEYNGLDAIESFLDTAIAHIGSTPTRLVPTRANTQPAFGFYLGDPQTPLLRATGLFVLTLEGDRISALTRFESSVLSRFGLPRTLRGHGSSHTPGPYPTRGEHNARRRGERHGP